MDIEDYQEKDISGKILYLASLFKGIKDHLKILNEMDELTGVESQMFTILNDLQLGINELCILYEKIEKVLTEREKEIIKLRYGLTPSGYKTQREIAQQLDISRSYVSRIEKKALKKLKRELNIDKNNINKKNKNDKDKTDKTYKNN